MRCWRGHLRQRLATNVRALRSFAGSARSPAAPAPHEAELAAMFLPELRALRAELGAPIDRWIARAESALELRAAS